MLSVVTDAQTQPELCLDLDELAREGARRMLASAWRPRSTPTWPPTPTSSTSTAGGWWSATATPQPRTLAMGAGAVEVAPPRVDDRRVDPETGERARFASAILPRWVRRRPKVAEVLPLLYLHGLSTGDFAPALAEFFGSSAGLSASAVGRLAEQWQAEHAAFGRRDLGDRDYVYCWADGIHFTLRLADGRLCALVIVGVRADGTKELVAVAAGTRESTEDWAGLLRDLRRRGMRAPVVMVGDGALGCGPGCGRSSPTPASRDVGSTRYATCSARSPQRARPQPDMPSTRSWPPRTAPTPSGRSRRSPPSSASSGPRPSPRSSTTPIAC